MNRTMLASTILAAAGGAGTAYAQDAGLEEITVTGSRIVRRDLDAASPIMTIDTERLENSSTLSIESVLNQMPQFVPDNTQFDGGTNVASGAVTPGIATVNLRGIGATSSTPSARPRSRCARSSAARSCCWSTTGKSRRSTTRST